MKRLMSKFQTKEVISVMLLIIQLFDIFTHAINGQLEPIRVQSNIIIVLWVFYLYIKPNPIRLKIMTTITLSVYLILNFLFLFANGWVNPNDNSIRVMLILLVVLTSLLSMVRYILNDQVKMAKK